MTAIADSRTTVSSRGSSALSVEWLGVLLVIASLIELTILRIGTRTFIHIPDVEEIAGPLAVGAAAGRLAFFFAVVALILLLAKLTAERFVHGDFRVASALGLFLFAAAAAGLGGIDSDRLDPVVVVVIALLATSAGSRSSRLSGLMIALFTVGYLLSALRTIAQPGLTDDFIDRIGASGSIRLAELLVVVAALLSWPVRRRMTGESCWTGRWTAWVSAIVGVLLVTLLTANRATTTILMLWNFGVTGVLPSVVYGLALTSVLLTISSMARSGETRRVAALALLILGGVGLTSTYQSGLTLAGLGLLLPVEVDSFRLLSDGRSWPTARTSRGRQGRRR